jgi:hypothetical protein
MDAIHWTSINGLLNPFSAVTVLADHPGPAIGGLHQKSIAGHMGAITAADAHRFIHPNGLFP